MQVKLIVLTVLAVTISANLWAVSGAKKKRGASCSETCTIDGKEVITNMMLTPTSENLTHNAEQYLENYKEACDVVSKDDPGNLHWCEAQCTGSGGIYTKLFNRSRKEQVLSFVKERKTTCTKLHDDLAAALKSKEEALDEKISTLKKLKLIDDYFVAQKTYDDYLAEKLEQKSFFTREQTVKDEALKSPEAVNLANKRKALEDVGIKADLVSAVLQKEKLVNELSAEERPKIATGNLDLVMDKLTKEKAHIAGLRNPGQSAQANEVKTEASTAAPSEVVPDPIKDKALHDIETFIDKDVAAVWRGVFDKFPHAIKAWTCSDTGEFKLDLNTPLRLWLPPAEKDDPSKGVVLTFGLNEKGESIGSMMGTLTKESKDMAFSDGAKIFVRPDQKQATPGFINLTNIRYVGSDEIHVITKKDLKKDFGRFLLPIVGAIAKRYGTVDNEYQLTVDKKRTQEQMIKSWNTDGKPVDNEKKAVGLE